MDISIKLAVASTIIACIALWISYKVYSDTKIGRMDERLTELRVRVVALKNHAYWVKEQAEVLCKAFPTEYNYAIRDSVIISTKKIKMLNIDIQKNYSRLKEKDLGDVSVSIEELTHAIKMNERMIEIIMMKCGSGDIDDNINDSTLQIHQNYQETFIN